MNGIILVDKPEGWTSHDVVGKLRGILRERRIGHSGTLDPMATGLLVVFVGRATRAVEFAEAHSKEYIAGLRLGVTTDTQDITGNILSECREIPDRQRLESAIELFKGEISQIPPMYSAVKLGGKKLYELARRGEEVERKPRKVTINKLDILSGGESEYTLDVICSKGTYIRTLCNDIGTALGCGACMSSLRRIRAGMFSLEDAHSIDEIRALADEGKVSEIMLPVDSLFAQNEKLTVNGADERKLRNGSIIECSASEGVYRVFSGDGEFLLLGDVCKGRLKTIKSFFEVGNE